MTDVTERKQAAEALEESEERYRLLVDNATVGVAVLQEGLFRYVNPHVIASTGYSEEELLSQPFADLVHPDDRATVMEYHQKRMQGEEALSVFPFRILSKDGHVMWLEVAAVGHEWEGRPATLSFITDITERARAAEALEESEEKYRTLVNNATQGIAVGQEGLIRFANPRFVEIMGYSDEELGSRPFIELVHPDDRQMILELRQQRAKGEEVSSFAFRVMAKDGQVKWLGVNAVAFEWQGQPAVLHFLNDITERKQAEEALKESEEKLNAMLRSIADHMSMVDKDLNITWANETTKRTYGDDVVGRKCYEVYHRRIEPCEPHPCITLKAFEDGKAHQCEREAVVEDGRLLHLLSTANVALKDDEGKPLTVLETSRDITKRVLAAEALRKTQESLALAQRIAHMGSWDWDLVTDQLAWSDEICRIFGLEPQQFGATSQAFFDSVHPDDRKMIKEAGNAAFEEGEPFSIEHRIVRPDGSERVVHEEAEVMRDQEGRAVRMIGTVQDVTERKLAEDELERHRDHLEEMVEERTAELGAANLQLQEEVAERKRAAEALKQSEEKYRSLHNNLPLGIFRSTPEGNIISMNHALVRMFGCESEEEAIKIPADQFHSDPQRRDELTRRLRTEGSVTDFEILIRRQDGSEFWTSSNVHAVVDEEGKIVYLDGIVSDISERKQAEEELLRSERRYRELFNSISDFVYTHDLEGRFLSINPVAAASLGYTPDELMGRPVADFMAPRYQQDFYDEYLPRIRKEGRFDGIFIFVAKDGVEHCIELRNVVVEREGFNPYVSGSARDITERVWAEKELLKAKEAAEAASKAKSTFLANMSHEIRTPMNAIMGMTSLVLDTDLDDEQREFLETVQTSSHHLLDVINDILDISRIEAGKAELEEVVFSPRASLDQVMKILSLQAEGKGLNLTYRVRPEVPEAVVGDAGRLRQVIFNLVNNAIKFTEKGQVEVEVGVDSLSEDEVVLGFRVADTGVGIPPDKLDEIFDPFAQADSSMTRKYGGTGLGLAISREWVRMMGGEIWVESEPERGSTFSFTARFRPGELKESETPARSAATGKGSSERLMILLAEDNPVNQRLAVALLKKQGHEVKVAADGLEALKALEEEGFDLILMDVQMPEMDGFEATAAIRQKEKDSGGRIPIIGLTAHAMSGDRERCLAAGMDDYVAKPFDSPSLVAALERLSGS